MKLDWSQPSSPSGYLISWMQDLIAVLTSEDEKSIVPSSKIDSEKLFH